MTENAETIADAFARAWTEIANPELDGINPHYKNRYATLKATLATVRAACRPHGIAYIQTLAERDGRYRIESRVINASGDEIRLSAFPIENTPNPQAFGSEMTYKKRQQAQADWGIVGDEDEDGEAAAAAQASKTDGSAKKSETPAPKANGRVKRQATTKYDKLKQLKAQALEIGIAEEGMNGAIANVLQGKPLKDATEIEIKACEACLATLIDDKNELLREANHGNQ